MKGKRFLQIAVSVVLAIGAVGVFSGCQEKELRERNLALQAQMERQAIQIGQLQRQLDETSAGQEVVVVEPAATDEASPVDDEVPDFGKGIEVTEDGGVVTVVLPNTILFSSGQAILKPASRAVLQQIADVLQAEYPNDVIRVEGHTDNEPIRASKKKWKSNWELSCARAMAVVHHLVEKGGLDPKRVYAAGFASHQPVADNATAAGRAKNRRVQIVIAPK